MPIVPAAIVPQLITIPPRFRNPLYAVIEMGRGGGPAGAVAITSRSGQDTAALFVAGPWGTICFDITEEGKWTVQLTSVLPCNAARESNAEIWDWLATGRVKRLNPAAKRTV